MSLKSAQSAYCAKLTYQYYIGILYVTQLNSNALFHFDVWWAHFNPAFNRFTFLYLVIFCPFLSIFVFDCSSPGSAGIGLIFTRSQEVHSQTGWPKLAKQTECSILCEAMLGADWGGWLGKASCSVGTHWALSVRESCSVYSCDILCIFLASFIVATVHFLCCSVKLSLSQPKSFAFFLPILVLTPAEGRMIEQLCSPLLPARTKPRHCSL